MAGRRKWITQTIKSPMAHFHLMHCIPDPRMHGLNGYKEVIETVGWGLEQLGHRATYAVNERSPDATNIVFGAQVMPVSSLAELPSTISSSCGTSPLRKLGARSDTSPKCRISPSGTTAPPICQAGARSDVQM